MIRAWAAVFCDSHGALHVAAVHTDRDMLALYTRGSNALEYQIVELVERSLEARVLEDVAERAVTDPPRALRPQDELGTIVRVKGGGSVLIRVDERR